MNDCRGGLRASGCIEKPESACWCLPSASRYHLRSCREDDEWVVCTISGKDLCLFVSVCVVAWERRDHWRTWCWVTPPLFIHSMSSSRNYLPVAVILWFLEYQTYRNTSQECQDTADNRQNAQAPHHKTSLMTEHFICSFSNLQVGALLLQNTCHPASWPPDHITLFLYVSLKQSSAEKNTSVSTYRE